MSLIGSSPATNECTSEKWSVMVTTTVSSVSATLSPSYLHCGPCRAAIVSLEAQQGTSRPLSYMLPWGNAWSGVQNNSNGLCSLLPPSYPPSPSLLPGFLPPSLFLLLASAQPFSKHIWCVPTSGSLPLPCFVCLSSITYSFSTSMPTLPWSLYTKTIPSMWTHNRWCLDGGRWPAGE